MTELAQDGEFQVAAALPLATAPPIARDCDGAADDGVESRHVREGYVFRPARFFENGTQRDWSAGHRVALQAHTPLRAPT